jgi:hypothetical protein
LMPGGRLVLVHWTGATDYPLTGDQVHDHVIGATARYLRLTQGAVHRCYRLDVLTRTDHEATASLP